MKICNIICQNKIQRIQTKTILLKFYNISLQYIFAILKMVGYMRVISSMYKKVVSLIIKRFIKDGKLLTIKIVKIILTNP